MFLIYTPYILTLFKKVTLNSDFLQQTYHKIFFIIFIREDAYAPVLREKVLRPTWGACFSAGLVLECFFAGYELFGLRFGGTITLI